MPSKLYEKRVAFESKKGEYAVPANEIKGPAPGKTIKKPPENEGKTARKRRRTKVALRLQFGSILEGFLTPF